MLQKNSPDATCTKIPYALALSARDAGFSVSKLVTAELLSPSRMTNRHGH